MTDTIEDKVRDRAFAIWVEEGRPEGRAEEHWFKALAELAAAKPPARKKAAIVATGKPSAKDGEKKAASPRKASAAKKAAVVATGEPPPKPASGRGKNVKV